MVVNDGNIDPNDRNTIVGNPGANGVNVSTMGMLFRTGGDKVLTLRSVVGESGSDTDGIGAVNVTGGQWYEFHLDIEKTSTTNTFQLTAAIDLLNGDGTSVLTPDLLTGSQSFANSAAYNNGLFAGFHMDVSGAAATISASCTSG